MGGGVGKSIMLSILLIIVIAVYAMVLSSMTKGIDCGTGT